MGFGIGPSLMEGRTEMVSISLRTPQHQWVITLNPADRLGKKVKRGLQIAWP